MSRDPFAEVRPGQKLRGLPAPAWNAMLKAVKPKAGPAAGGAPFTAVEIGVKNATGAPLDRFGIVKATRPTFPFVEGQEADSFRNNDVQDAQAPAAGEVFAVTQEPLSADQIGVARIAGLTRVRVDVTDAAHGYAGCTTSTQLLASAARGPARILWVESDRAGARATGEQWAVVLLGGGAAPETGFVKPSTSSPGADGLYPGVLLDQVGRPREWPAVAQVWVEEVEGRDLTAGQKYLGRKNADQVSGLDVYAVANCCDVADAASGCCTGFTPPDQLCMTVTAPTVPAIDGSKVLFTGDGVAWSWTAAAATLGTFCGTWGFVLSCSGGGWSFYWLYDGTVGSFDPACTTQCRLNLDTVTIVPTDCDPFALAVDVTLSAESGPPAYACAFAGEPATFTFGTDLTDCTGSGSGGGGGAVTTACCETTLPRTLYAHVVVSAGAGTPDANGQSIPLSWFASGGDDYWTGSLALGGKLFLVTFACVSGSPSIQFGTTDPSCYLCLPVGGVSADCATPSFVQSFTTPSYDSCIPSGTLTVTVNATP